MIRRQAVKNTDNPPGQIVNPIADAITEKNIQQWREYEWSKQNLVPKEVMMSDLARDEYNHIGHTEYMKKYRKE